jgi:hypothetical protein
VLDGQGAIVSHDTRYFLASSDPGSVCAHQLLSSARDHWQVENSLHFPKDRWWDEDRHHTRRPGLAEALAMINSMALTVLRACCSPLEPLRAHADRIAWQPVQQLLRLGLA